jgi:8-oxo-dGTP pyrophosphatase MutT (NUDIX family)
MEEPIPIERLTPEAIAARLRGPRRRTVRELARVALPASPRCAAVLVPLFREEGIWRLMYIRRAEHAHDHHSGQVAFPGGRCEPPEREAVETALREAREEVGLDPCSVEVLGTLAPVHTVSGFLVTPVVGCLRWPQPLTLDPAEVARVFSIPLAWLGDPANRAECLWPEGGHPLARRVVFYEPFEGERLWGVTAGITLDFLDRLSAPPR